MTSEGVIISHFLLPILCDPERGHVFSSFMCLSYGVFDSEDYVPPKCRHPPKKTHGVPVPIRSQSEQTLLLVP
jgi:hypothetical protein